MGREHRAEKRKEKVSAERAGGEGKRGGGLRGKWGRATHSLPGQAVLLLQQGKVFRDCEWVIRCQLLCIG